MKVLVVGNGGREHAIAWALARSPLSEMIYVAPGNGGTALEPKCENVPIDPGAFDKIIDLIDTKGIGLTVIGPEAPLADGIVDYLKGRGKPCLGPTRAAAQLESSKAYAKLFMKRHKIPTARFGIFEEKEKALEFADSLGFPVVIKADGLAAGKGVIIGHDPEEAGKALEGMISGKAFGPAGRKVVVEECLRGQEASFIVITDGNTIIPLATSQDHKTRDDGDKGPNTGGMGAYSPTPILTEEISSKVMEWVIKPAVQGMAEEGIPYVGFLYAGLMIGKERIDVLEFNCRLGDPETQPILLRLSSDFLELCLKCLHGDLKGHSLDWDPRTALGVVMASRGYPFAYEKGYEIKGLEGEELEGVKVFHAGTKLSGKKVLTNGGRVLCVTALGDGLREARQRAYERAAQISWEGAFYRKDIGVKGLS